MSETFVPSRCKTCRCFILARLCSPASEIEVSPSQSTRKQGSSRTLASPASLIAVFTRASLGRRSNLANASGEYFRSAKPSSSILPNAF